MAFPAQRLRRLRSSLALRGLVRETCLHPSDLVLPLFVRPGTGVRQPISSMPGHFQHSVDSAAEEARRARALGLPAVILFGIPEKKDPAASEAYAKDGIIQQALKAVKDAAPELIAIADLCFCEYTDHGHCGILKASKEPSPAARKVGFQAGAPAALAPEKGHAGGWALDNDATLEILAKTAVSQAEAGADVVAPSGMIDGQVGAIRRALDSSGYQDTPILSYAAKYASAFYGPFREAAESSPQFGDRSGYQMDPANRREALREVELDIQEGADMVMVKPALGYLDVLAEVKDRFGLPTAAYSVSGEFSMVKAAAERGWLDEKRTALEMLTSIKRAGADFILTYYALEAARWLHE